MIFWTALRGSQNSSVALSQVMNHGFWSTSVQMAQVMDFGVRTRDKRRSREWHTANSPLPKKARMSKSMLICFFDSQRIVHKEFVPQGQTVNHTFYWEVLERLRKRVAHVRPDIARTWMLHHDNAPLHAAFSINEFLAEKSIPVVPQPPIRRISVPVKSFYSPGSKPT